MIILYVCRWESFIPRILGVHVDSWTPTLTPRPPTPGGLQVEGGNHRHGHHMPKSIYQPIHKP